MQYSSSSENYSSSFKDSKGGHDKGDKGGYAYKKSAYQYSSGGSNIGVGNNNISYGSKKPVDQNIEQLDALLEDLKNERTYTTATTTRDKDLLSSPTASSTLNYRTIDLGRNDAHAPGTITKTTRIVQTSKTGTNHDVIDNILPINSATSDYSSTLRSNDYSTLRYDDKLYESNRNIPRNIYGSKNQIYESHHRTVENIEPLPLSTANTTSDIITTTATTSQQLKDDLNKIVLSDDILPSPGTKVTTTVRTYTYEIPANASPNILSNQRTQNITSSHQHENVNIGGIGGVGVQPHPVSAIPSTVVYNTESYSIHDKSTQQPIVTNQSYQLREHHESTTNTSYPSTSPLHSHPPTSQLSPLGGPTTKTIVYNVNTTKNINQIEPEPPTNYTRTTTRYINDGPNGPPLGGHPVHPVSGQPDNQYPGQPTTNRYYYKESTNTVNTIRGPPLPSGYPPYGDNGYPNQQSPQPNNTNIIYKYTTNTTNTRRGLPDYGTPSPTMPPAPFPVDGIEQHPSPNGNPPQRVDDLMQSFEQIDSVNRSGNLQSPHRKREIETSVASPKQQNVPTINKAGKEVFYPPGMLAKHEEMQAGSAGGGRWAKGSGMYEYESGYKSKSSSKSGGAMVPVCLPLCCAMPCSIM